MERLRVMHCGEEAHAHCLCCRVSVGQARTLVKKARTVSMEW